MLASLKKLALTSIHLLYPFNRCPIFTLRDSSVRGETDGLVPRNSFLEFCSYKKILAIHGTIRGWREVERKEDFLFHVSAPLDIFVSLATVLGKRQISCYTLIYERTRGRPSSCVNSVPLTRSRVLTSIFQLDCH